MYDNWILIYRNLVKVFILIFLQRPEIDEFCQNQYQ